MTVIGLKNKYPNFRFGNDGKGGKEYIFTINSPCETKADLNAREYTDIFLELTCEIEELINNEDFINWLDAQWTQQAMLNKNKEK